MAPKGMIVGLLMTYNIYLPLLFCKFEACRIYLGVLAIGQARYTSEKLEAKKMLDKGAKVTFTYDGNETSGKILHILAAGKKPAAYFDILTAADKALEADRCFDETRSCEDESYLVVTKRSKNTVAKIYWLSKDDLSGVQVVVRQYGLLQPSNWQDDCFNHLYLQNRYWNCLVEIEQDNRNKYRALVGEDEDVAPIQDAIDGLKSRIADMAEQRTQLKIEHCKKIGIHTEPLDNAIKAAKAEMKKLSNKAKEARAVAKERIRAAGPAFKLLEDERRQSVKEAYNNSQLWWGNYNAITNSYNTARTRAMKEGADLRFHRFDGSGRFTCQIMGGMSTDDLLSGRNSVAQLRKVSNSEFTKIIKSNPPALQLQLVGSRRDEREYGVLSITIYTAEDDQGKKTRRTLDFPIILHRPLPENATLKIISVNRKKIGTDYRWAVTFTFSEETKESIVHTSKQTCGINLGWKQVAGGLRVATVSDGTSTRHVVLPQVIIDKLAYTESLQSRIDTATNENFIWLLGKMADPPEILKGDVTSLKRSKRPHPAKFAKFVIKWRNECSEFEPQALIEAEVMRKNVKRLSLEHHHLRDKVLRRRIDFYRNEAKKIADKYSMIVMDKMDLRQMSALEKSDGTPNELADLARYHRKVAAISEFREWIGKQAIKAGGAVEMIAIESTRTCNACDGVMAPSDGLMFRCKSCGTFVDQDENASANLLRAVT